MLSCIRQLSLKHQIAIVLPYARKRALVMASYLEKH